MRKNRPKKWLGLNLFITFVVRRADNHIERCEDVQDNI